VDVQLACREYGSRFSRHPLVDTRHGSLEANARRPTLKLTSLLFNPLVGELMDP
jgi:hypothetical protein